MNEVKTNSNKISLLIEPYYNKAFKKLYFNLLSFYYSTDVMQMDEILIKT